MCTVAFLLRRRYRKMQAQNAERKALEDLKRQQEREARPDSEANLREEDEQSENGQNSPEVARGKPYGMI